MKKSTYTPTTLKTILPLSWWIPFILFVLHQSIQYGLGWNVSILDNYLDPLLVMPILLGLISLERRYFFEQAQLSGFEITVITIVLALLFEEVFPLLKSDFIRDWWDYLMYGLGSLYFYFFGRKGQIR